MSTRAPDADESGLLRDRFGVPTPHEHHFTSPLHTPTVTARIGLWLGIAFGTCFVTGLISHFLQHPPFFWTWPTRPVGLYRFTQGLHVITGTAAIPLLGAKLWTVYPKLFAPFRFAPTRVALVAAVERASVLVLVGAAIFQVFTGLLDTAQYYPWGFFFTTAHHAMSYVLIGSLLVHVAVKLPVIRTALGVPVSSRVDADTLEVTPGPVEPGETAAGRPGLPRRTFLRATWLSAGVAAVAVAGTTVPFLRHVSVLGVRSGDGPQGVPVNRTAEQANVREQATDPAWAVTVRGPSGEQGFTLAQLQALPQTTQSLPIACVEGWSAGATWTGVTVRELVSAVGGSSDADVRFTSFDTGLYGSSVLPARHARSPLSLVALRLNGEVLDLDHGFPARLIAPSRPGVTQTKWLTTIEVL